MAAGPVLLINNIEADNDSIKSDNDPAISIVDCIFSNESAYNIPASNPTATVMIIIEGNDDWILLEHLAKRANIPIKVEIANVAPASLDPSINDNAATAPAITVIATTITIRLPFTSLAPCVAFIMPIMKALNIPTAVRPFIKPPTSIRLIAIDTAAKIPIATAIDNIVADTLAIFCSFPIFVTATNAFISTTKAATNIPPLTISSGDNIPTSLHTPTIKAIEIDIDNNNPPSLGSSLSIVLVTTPSKPTNITNAVANTAPCNISSADNVPTSLQTPTISIMATDIFFTIFPNLSVYSSDPLEAFASILANITNAVANKAPCIISSADNMPTNLHTATINSIETAILLIILPTLSKCSNDEPLVIFPITPINTAISIIIAVSPINPFIAFSGFIFPINLTVLANNNIAIPI